MSEPNLIFTTLYGGDITKGLITVRMDPKHIRGRTLGEPIAVLFDPPPVDDLKDHPELPLQP